MKKTEGFQFLKSEFFQGFENWLLSGDGLSFPSLFISYERELIGGINWPLNGSLTFFLFFDAQGPIALCRAAPQRQEGAAHTVQLE